MAQLKGKDLIVANTTNVKEMKNGRPMNVKVTEELGNCAIVKLGARGTGVEDHIYTAVALTAEDFAKALEAGEAYVVVAPEIMVEEARKIDGHIGLFRLEAGQVYTAYQLSKHDRLEVSEGHPAIALGTKVGERNMAEAMFLLAEGEKQPAIKMIKVEF